MKLNKLFFILFTLALSLGFTSCSDDDDNYSAKDIIGVWDMTASATRVTTNNGKATELVNAFLSQNDNEGEQVFIFEEGGICLGKDNLTGPVSYSGTYHVKGNKLYFVDDEDSYEYTIASLSENSLGLSVNTNLNNSLVNYLTEVAESGPMSIAGLEQLFKAASIDMSTIKVKNVKHTSTFAKVLTVDN